MESLQPSRDSARKQKSDRENQRAASVTLRVRLWSYGGPQGKLDDLVWKQDQEVADLVHAVIREGQGTVTDDEGSRMVHAQFSDPLQALSTAKFLQLRLLTLHREPPACQVVAAIMVDDQSAGKSPASQDHDALEEANSAQILVSGTIHDLARNLPGFDFTSKPARESADGTALETLYELRWTDESTYGHLRKTSESTGTEVRQKSRYTIQSELGRGCMGIVYKAYDEVIGRQVALKTIAVNRAFPNRNDLIERLKQEAKAAGSLDHPNIITIFDVGEEDELIYLSMQLVDGKTLMNLLTDGDLPPLPTLLSYADQILSAVGYAHQRNVIHRDLKPANFMLTSQGVIKVLDFGIAKIEDATLTQAGMIVGTPTYMAPEQARAKKVDQRSDIFSLGSVFYELFTRERPFKGDVTTVLYKLIHEDPVPPSVINPALPAGIDAVIRKALAKEPVDRFQSCEEMRQAFQEQAALLESAAAQQAPTPAKVRPVTVDDLLEEVKPRRRSFGYLWFGLIAGIVLAATGVGVWAIRVKVNTGSFPPMVEKLLAAVHIKTGSQPQETQAAASQPAVNSAAGSSQPAAAPATGTQPPAATPSTEDPNSSSAPATPPSSSSAQPATADASNAGQTTPPASSATDNARTQPGPDNSAASSSSQAATTEDSGTKPSSDANPFKPRRHNEKGAATPADTGAKVEGFSRRDVPMLLSKADAAAGRGDYSLAEYEYNLVLRLDRGNATARAGLRRVTAAQQDQAQH